MTEHRIIQGDVLAGLRTLPDACVQCTVTSPPYWMLRNYGVDGQIGGFPSAGYKREFKGWEPTCKCDSPLLTGQYPPRAPKPCIVLDPFMGSGTVAVVARDLNRSSIGCELNPEYVKIIRKRLQSDSQLDTGVVSYRVEVA